VTFDVRTRVQPDLLVVPLVDGRRPRSFAEVRHLLPAVEVLSPTTTRTDRRVKRPLYQREGVDEYWMVDADAAIVERWRPGDERPEVRTEQIAWHPSGATKPLTIAISEIIDD
jgi:Uma2 family endonuclease